MKKEIHSSGRNPENKQIDTEKYSRNILDTLCTEFLSFYFLDFSKKQIVTLKKQDMDGIPEKRTQIHCFDSYEESLKEYFESYIDKESAPDFVQRLSPGFIEKVLATDQKLTYRFSMITDQGEKHHLEVFISRSESLELTAVMGFRLIDDIIAQEEEKKAQLQEQLDTIGGLSNAYFAVYWVDLQTDRCKAVKNIPFFDQAVKKCVTTDQVAVAFNTLCVHPEDQEKMRAFTDWRRLTDLLENSDTLVEEFHGAIMPWEWCRASWIVADRNTEGKAVSALFAIEDISARIAERMQQEQQRKLIEEQTQIINGLSQEYSTVWLVTEKGRHGIKYQDTGTEEIVREALFISRNTFDYTDGMQDYTTHFICEEEQEEFTEKTRYEVVLQEIHKQPIYSVVYRRNYHEKKEYYQVSFTLADRDGESNDFIMGFKNVDAVVLAQKQKEEELAAALERAEDASRAKTHFLNNMSHDIRTPMNALLGYSKLVKKELKDPKLLGYQEKIEQAGNLLLSIINNILDMARIESGRMEIDLNYAKVKDMLNEITAVFDAEAESKGIRFIYSEDVTHQHILCDGTKVKEIFVNLISNAIKYTPSGGTVMIKTQEMPCDREGFIKIKTEVADTGIGMSKDYIPSLFDSFSRERNTTMGKVAGTGLGMSIVKNLVHMMGGSIEVESEPGRGTRFTVILSYKIADKIYYEQKSGKISDTDAKKIIEGKHVLLAEDNDLNAEIAMVILDEMGLVAERVCDGIQCISKLEQKSAGSYDVILMDIQMPNMDGYKATQNIRKLRDKAKAEIPIVAMTANAFEEDKKLAFSKGMNGHIAKPIEAEKIEEVLLSVLK